MPIVTDCDPQIIERLMKHPDIYSACADDFHKNPEEVSFQEQLARSNVLTFVAVTSDRAVGFVHYVAQSEIVCEIHCGFIREARGKVAREIVEATMSAIFLRKNMLKIIARIPEDNRAAIGLARLIGFKREGSITKSILRGGKLIDQHLYGMCWHDWNAKHKLVQVQ